MERPVPGQIDFRNPPVIETALSVQFAALPGFNATHFGQFFERIRSRFPYAVDQPRLPTVLEMFPRRQRALVTSIELRPSPVPDRLWYMDRKDNASTLIQLQPDRFGFNWRRQGAADYPRWSANFERCMNEFAGFVAFTESAGIGPVAPDLCEVIYVNDILPRGEESTADVFARTLAGVEFHSPLPSPASIAFNRVYDVEPDSIRLYAETAIAFDPTKGEFVRFTLTARVRPGGSSVEMVRSSLQHAHDWILLGFEKLTSASAQVERWGRVS